MENKNMLVSEFVKKYNTLTNDQAKAKLVKSIMKTNYVGIVTKRAVLQNAIEKSIVDKGMVVYVDSLTSKTNFAVSLVLMYTNLEFDKKQDGTTDTFGCYDLLMSNDVFDVIIAAIGEREIEELGGVHASLLENNYVETSSGAAIVLRCFNKSLGVINSILEKIIGSVENVLTDETILANINEAVKKYKK